MLISIIIILGIHLITWKIWGHQSLMKKGFTYIEKNEYCNSQFQQMNSPYVQPDTTIILKAEKFWFVHSMKDTVINITLYDSTIQVYSSESFRRKGLLDDMYERDIGYQVLISDYYSDFNNPYLQKTFYACWALGSDFSIEFDFIQIWMFFGWVKLFDYQDLIRYKYDYINPIFDSSYSFPLEG